MIGRTLLAFAGLGMVAAAAGAADWTLRSSLQTSGGLSEQTPHRLHGAVHEPVAGVSEADGFVLRSGFLAASSAPATSTPGDVWAIR